MGLGLLLLAQLFALVRSEDVGVAWLALPALLQGVSGKLLIALASQRLIPAHLSYPDALLGRKHVSLNPGFDQ